jgi:SAM-dependent methyltransferase
MSVSSAFPPDPDLLKRQQRDFYQANEKYYRLLDEQFQSGYTYADILEALVRRQQSPVRFLDVGAGSGYYVRHAMELGCLAVGVDLSRHAGRSGSGPSPIMFCQADAETLPFLDARFDVVFCQQLIEHVVFPERVLAEISRILRPGGLVFLSAPNRLGRHTLPKLRRILQELWGGTEHKRIVAVSPGVLQQWAESDDVHALEDTDLCNETTIFQGLRLVRRAGLTVERFDTLRHPKKYSRMAYRLARFASRLPLARYAGVNFKIVARKPANE